MTQSRAMSLVEATVNVAAGFVVALATQAVVFPVFGLRTSFSDDLAIASVFTGVSLARSYLLRRLFERLRPRPGGRGASIPGGFRPGTGGGTSLLTTAKFRRGSRDDPEDRDPAADREAEGRRRDGSLL